MSLAGKHIEINGVNYYVQDSGTGDRTVLLLHGMPDTSKVWKYQVPALVEAGYRVVAPDLLGYGESDKPADIARYDGALLAADMVALIQSLGDEPIDIVGHDWGAFFSWTLAIEMPSAIRRHVALSVGHPQMFATPQSVDEIKANWYMYLNTQQGAAELYALDNCKFYREFIIPTHPELEDVCARLSDPSHMRGMLNLDLANPVSAMYLAQRGGAPQLPNSTVPTLGM